MVYYERRSLNATREMTFYRISLPAIGKAESRLVSSNESTVSVGQWINYNDHHRGGEGTYQLSGSRGPVL
jgi:hypothetical protein